MFFIYKQIDNKEQLLHSVQEQIYELQEVDHANTNEIQNRVLMLFSTATKYHPMLGFVDNNLPYITKELCPSSMTFLIAEEQKEIVEQPQEEKKPNSKKKKMSRSTSNFIWDSVFSLFVPMLLIVFVFTIVESLYKKNAGLAITFIFISYVEPAILVYDLYTTYKNDKNYHPFSLEKCILYVVNIVGIAIGAVIANILAKQVFKLESAGLIRSFILMAGLISAGIILLVHLIVVGLVKRNAKKQNKKEQ